ncbi:hypothetical protein ACLOJK_017675 [Asimina triloba]
MSGDGTFIPPSGRALELRLLNMPGDGIPFAFLSQDDPVCVAARSDGKILVTNLWVEDSLDIGSLAVASRILYSPVRDLRGISGAESLYICLTGYQGKDRDDIMVCSIRFPTSWESDDV